MMATRQHSARSDNSLALLGLVTTAFAVVLAVWLAGWAGGQIEGYAVPANPAEFVLGLVLGSGPWSIASTVVLVLIGVVLIGIAALVFRTYLKSQAPLTRIDRAAPKMAKRKDVAHLLKPGATKKARRLGVGEPHIGIPLGLLVPTTLPMWASFEDMLLVIAGPRTQKTTGYAIPMIMAAPGACLVTSNKRDIVDATRGPRSEKGHCWVFDPQGVADTAPAWWWNPLDYVTDEVRAEKLAAQFAMSTASSATKTYWDDQGIDLLSLLLLAAALDRRPITAVYEWLTDHNISAPETILEQHRYALQARSMQSFRSLPDKQREGVYDAGRRFTSFLRSRKVAQWVTPPQHRLPQFDTDKFARSSDTLYLLSKEGGGSAGPIVAALAVAVAESCEMYATTSPGGRMPTPFLGILDEAANICRFKDLDSLYSHYGSRGILFVTIFQNWAQGEDVYGREGMEKLWSASNVKIYAGNVDDVTFLERCSKLIGEYDQVMTSESRQQGKTSQSRSIQSRTILTVSDLRSMPPGRAVCFASGTPAFIAAPQQWFNGPDADAINASFATYGPKGAAQQIHLPITAEIPTVTATPAKAMSSPWDIHD